jgi:hypothetical protein
MFVIGLLCNVMSSEVLLVLSFCLQCPVLGNDQADTLRTVTKE